MEKIIHPRSPRETMAGWVYLPRFIDKIRLHLAGKLDREYQDNFAAKGFDLAWLKASGVNAEQFIEVVKNSITDGEVCDWVQKNVKKTDAEKIAHRDNALKLGSREGDPAVHQRLQQRKAESGFSHRDDIQNFFDYIDADEKRI